MSAAKNNVCRTCGLEFDDNFYQRCDYDVCFWCMNERWFQHSYRQTLRSAYLEKYGPNTKKYQEFFKFSINDQCQEKCNVYDGDNHHHICPCIEQCYPVPKDRYCDQNNEICFNAWGYPAHGRAAPSDFLSNSTANNLYNLYFNLYHKLLDTPAFRAKCFLEWIVRAEQQLQEGRKFIKIRKGICQNCKHIFEQRDGGPVKKFCSVACQKQQQNATEKVALIKSNATRYSELIKNMEFLNSKEVKAFKRKYQLHELTLVELEKMLVIYDAFIEMYPEVKI